MSVQIKWRGDTTAAHSGFVGADREITIDTDKRVAVVHDGDTKGGFPMAREDLSNVDCLIGFVFSAPLYKTPAGFLYCDGAEISRIVYAKLFEKIGTTFGVGDGATTFRIPDYRGFFLRGLGGNSNADFATAQGDAMRHLYGTFDGNVNDNNAHKTGVFYLHYWGGSVGADGAGGGGLIGFDSARITPVAVENRPLNKAVHYFIKY